jgi:hypothetical protein
MKLLIAGLFSLVAVVHCQETTDSMDTPTVDPILARVGLNEMEAACFNAQFNNPASLAQIFGVCGSVLNDPNFMNDVSLNFNNRGCKATPVLQLHAWYSCYTVSLNCHLST